MEELRQIRLRLKPETVAYLEEFADDKRFGHLGQVIDHIATEHKQLADEKWDMQFLTRSNQHTGFPSYRGVDQRAGIDGTRADPSRREPLRPPRSDPDRAPAGAHADRGHRGHHDDRPIQADFPRDGGTCRPGTYRTPKTEEGHTNF